ncbi:SPFH domain-containing protein [Zophobihabitans entericus]|uniref:SPFH domain-containing protein n=1 Tax=Zophobihabitans entericus TaxID=1635327 RepID=A0A6G9I8S3_9GAMM|nr:SPFH domain-containing protein [Zophobihabitans entericus]QIQ20257.1 SPFH domain-containing protein [Zophobihabitans entericus]
MGLKNFFKRQLRTVIEWNSQDSNILFFQFEAPTDEIKTASKLIVNPGQGCLLVYEGKIIDVLSEQGTYSLKTANHPFITNLLKILQSFESEHKMRIYFYRKAEVVNQKWGTSTPIKYMDSVYKFPIELGAYGTYSLNVELPKAFFENIVGTKTVYTTKDLQQLMVSRIIPEISSHLATDSYSYQNIDSQLMKLSGELKTSLQGTFNQLGLALSDFRIEATSFNEETVARINRIAESRTDAIAAQEVGLDYVDHERLKALRDAAKNEGGLAGAGLQIGAGFELAKSFDLKKGGAGSADNQAVAQPAAEDPSIAQLKKLKSLLDDGILTQEEFDAKKKEILDRI